MAKKEQGDGRSRRGFASMDVAKQREIASKGGKAAHEQGTAHEFTATEASAAGKKGGQSRRAQAQRAQVPVPAQVVLPVS